MERLVEQPQHEKLKSFDPLASVDMYRFDLERFGQIQPETRQRVCDEELSFLAEGIDRQARTSFVLQRQNGELKYFDRGNWRSYRGMVWSGLRVAEQEAAGDSRLNFLAERAFSDLEHGTQMDALKPGEQYGWHSPYPEQEEKLYGKKFLQERGFQTDRKMGFLYMATGQIDGSVLLESQTVDRSDNDAFRAALEVLNDPEADLENMTHAYDRVLMEKHGGRFRAGRRDTEVQENVWQTIQNQRDLIGYFLDGIENIARKDLPRTLLEVATKKHTYGVWAAFKKRIDNRHVSRLEANQAAMINPLVYQQIAQEVRYAFQDFARQGKVLIGCGGAIKMLTDEQGIMEAASEDVFSSIFGSKSEEDDFGPLKFKCPRGHWNERKPAKSPKDFLPHCKTCKVSLKC